MLIAIKKEEWLGNIKNDILAGMVTSIALIPEVIGFALIAGVNPMTALFASVTTALVTSLTGGRPAMVSAAAGSMALVMVNLIKNHGIHYMVAATILTGIIQLVLGYLGIQKLMKFIPKSVMLGFVNALALLIFTAQIQQLLGSSLPAYLMVGLTIALMYTIPKVIKSVPPALIAIILMTAASIFLPLGVQTVGDMGDMSGGLPHLALPAIPLNFETLAIIFPTALALSIVGLLESLLTAPIVDEMTQTTSDQQREVKSQGLANIITGFFGGPAGCAMIGQAVINVKSGGRKRLSTFTAGLFLLFLIVVLKGLMIQIPTAALIGIMITVAIATFDWSSFHYVKTVHITEGAIMILTVAIVLYTHNLAIGVVTGVILSIIAFIAKISTIDVVKEGTRFMIHGQLFFASTHDFMKAFEEPLAEKLVILDFTHSHIWDDTSVEAILTVVKKLKAQDVEVQLEGLNTQSHQLLEKLKDYFSD